MTKKDNGTASLPKGIQDHLNKIKKNAKEYAKKVEDSKSFEIDPHLVALMWDEPFYSAVSRRITKSRVLDIPTAGVYVQDGSPTLLWNPVFFNEMPKEHIRGVLIHEFMHLIYDHVTSRRREPHMLWNLATDAAINSMIPRKNLPDNLVLPGELNALAGDDPIWKLISTWPLKKSSDWYMSQLLNDPDVQEAMQKQSQCPVHGDEDEDSDKGTPSPDKDEQDDDSKDSEADQDGNQDGESNDDGDQPGDSHGHGGSDKECNCDQGGQGSGEGYGFDDHEGWGDMSEAERELVNGKIREILRDAVKEADSRNGWGSVPAGCREELRQMVSNQVDWKSILRQTIGMATSSSKTNTRKKRNRKYKFAHPGVKRKRQARVFCAIDGSGSVSNEDIELLFGELTGLAKRVDIDIGFFDTQVDEKSIFTWKRGQRVAPVRTVCGGTDFNAPTEYINDKVKGKYDLLIILTDGEAPAPVACNVRRAWVICPDRKPIFETKETVIQMKHEDEKKNVA